MTGDDVPALVFSQGGTRTVRAFPEKLPIGVGAGQDVVFAYVVADPTGRDFPRFLGRHRRLFQRLPRWTVRVAFPVATQDSHPSQRAARTREGREPQRARLIRLSKSAPVGRALT